MSIIQKLQKINSDYNNASQCRNQARSLSLLSSGIYTEPERFVYELLQNAIDAFVDVDSEELDIAIKIVGDYLVFMHNGAAFSDSDIEGLCSVGNGNKTTDVKKVGYKGIGFKAVFIQSSLVYIQSGKNCCFKFDREACFDLLSDSLKAKLKGVAGPLYDDVPWQIVPIESKPPLDLNTNGFNVVIYIKMPKLAELLPRIDKLLKETEFLLFLKANRVSVSLFDNNTLITYISRTRRDEIVELAVNKRVKSRWMMHSKSVDITPEVREYIAQNVSSVPEKLRDAKQIEVAFSIEVGEDGKLKPLQNSVVYTYLPTSYGNLGVPFLINANFITDAGRQQLQKDSAWNKLIFREAPRLFLRWVSTLSHVHSEYYKVLPKRRAKLSDELSDVFFDSLSEAIQGIAFLPSVAVSNKKVLVADAYIDRIGFSEVFGAENFLDGVNSLSGSMYKADCKIIDVDDSILSSYGVKIFESSDVLRLLIDGKILMGITSDENFKLISFLRKKFTSQEEIESLKPVAFLLDDENNFNVVCDLCLPSDFKEKTASAEGLRMLNASLYDKLKGTDELRWLQVNFGIKEMSNFGFVEYILRHPDYINADNAVSVGRFLFKTWKKENYLERGDVVEEMARVNFLSKNGELKPIVNLYLGTKYKPRHDLECVAPGLDVFISPRYPEDGDELEDWTFFLKKCGASDSVGITQRILVAEPITSNIKEAEELKPYPILEEAAAKFYSKEHSKTGYCHYPNPIEHKRIHVSYFSFIDPVGAANHAVERYIFNVGLSQELWPELITDKISGEVRYWWEHTKDPMYKIVDPLFDHVVSKYKTFLEYAVAEKQLFPTTMGNRLPARDVFINSTEIIRLAGQYLPVLDIENPVHSSWRMILPFKEKLALDDYLTLLENISNDTENAKDNRDRISSIYQELILAEYSKDEKIHEWGKTHKILSKSGEYLLPSALSYITIAGFKSDNQVYVKVEDWHFQDQVIDLFRTLGVRIVDSVSPEFTDAIESMDLKDILKKNVAYIALIKSHYKRLDYNECLGAVENQIERSVFHRCGRIDLSYGDNIDKISRTTYADGGRFYYVGELGPSKMELLSVPLCKYLGLGDKDRELIVVLFSNTTSGLDEYFKDKGYAEDLLNKVKQVQNVRVREVSANGAVDSSVTIAPTTVSVSISDGQYAGLSKVQMKDALMEAKQMAKEKLEAEGFVFEQEISENDFSVINGVKKDGVEYPLVVHSYLNQTRQFQLNAVDWEQLVKPNSMLIVRTQQGMGCVPFHDLICNREKIDLSFSTKNLEIQDRIGALANVMRWFTGLHFDFGSSIQIRTGMVQFFDFPEQGINENERRMQLSSDDAEEVF